MAHRPAVVGIVGGLGLEAGIYYYRQIARLFPQALSSTINSDGEEDAKPPLQLNLSHADANQIISHAYKGDKKGLATYCVEGPLAALKAAGSDFAVIPAVTPHLAIEEMRRVSPIELVDILTSIRNEVQKRIQHKEEEDEGKDASSSTQSATSSQSTTTTTSSLILKVASFGSMPVQASKLYGSLDGLAEVVIPPPEEVKAIDEWYCDVALNGGSLTEKELDGYRGKFVSQAKRMMERDGVELILLAGTDLTTLFHEDNPFPFPHVDAAAVHIRDIVDRMMVKK